MVNQAFRVIWRSYLLLLKPQLWMSTHLQTHPTCLNWLTERHLWTGFSRWIRFGLLTRLLRYFLKEISKACKLDKQTIWKFKVVLGCTKLHICQCGRILYMPLQLQNTEYAWIQDNARAEKWKANHCQYHWPLRKIFLFFLKYLHANDQSAAIETFKDVERNLNNFVMLPVIF